MIQYRNCGCAILSVVIAASLAYGQDDKPADEKSPAERFKSAQVDWDTLEKDVKAVVAEFRTSDEAAREGIRKKYDSLIAKSSPVLKALREAAMAAYTAAPNNDAKVTQTLVRLLSDDVRRDDFEPALKLARLLLENKAENPLIYNYAGIAAYGVDDFAQAEQWLKIAQKNGTLDEQGELCLVDASEAKERFTKEQKIREKEAEADDLPRVKFQTNRGVILIELFENEAPDTVGNFVSLVEKGFYNGLTFHRVLPGFMAQGGDPDGTGGGGPGYEIYCECDKPEHRKHFRGTLSMAHAGKNTGGSQFFLTFRATPHLDGRHTAFGRVVEGFDVLPKLQRRDPQSENPPPPDRIVKAEVVRKRDHAYAPKKVE